MKYESVISGLERELAICKQATQNTVKEAMPESRAIAQLKTALTRKEAEISFLKETVRLECEERMGLVAMVSKLKQETTNGLPPIRNSGATNEIPFINASKPLRPSSSVNFRNGSRSESNLSTYSTPVPTKEAREFEIMVQAANAKKEKKIARQISLRKFAHQ